MGDPLSLTAQQINRAVTFEFTNFQELVARVGSTEASAKTHGRKFNFIGRPSVLCAEGSKPEDVVTIQGTDSPVEAQCCLIQVSSIAIVCAKASEAAFYQWMCSLACGRSAPFGPHQPTCLYEGCRVRKIACTPLQVRKHVRSAHSLLLSSWPSGPARRHKQRRAHVGPRPLLARPAREERPAAAAVELGGDRRPWRIRSEPSFFLASLRTFRRAGS